MIIKSKKGAENILNILDVSSNTIDIENFLEGLNVELEHLEYWQDFLFLSRIVVDHLLQDIDYYKKLRENNVENDEKILQILRKIMEEYFSISENKTFVDIDDSEIILGLNTELEHLYTTSDLVDLFKIMKNHFDEDPHYYSNFVQKMNSYDVNNNIQESSYKKLLDVEKEIEKTQYNIKKYREINDREQEKREREKLEYLENMKSYLEKYEGISFRRNLLKKRFIKK